MRQTRSPDLLSSGEAARLLGVSQDTLARMAEGGELPARRTPGGHWRFERSAVVALRDGVSRAA